MINKHTTISLEEYTKRKLERIKFISKAKTYNEALEIVLKAYYALKRIKD